MGQLFGHCVIAQDGYSEISRPKCLSRFPNDLLIPLNPGILTAMTEVALCDT